MAKKLIRTVVGVAFIAAAAVGAVAATEDPGWGLAPQQVVAKASDPGWGAIKASDPGWGVAPAAVSDPGWGSVGA
ncbi:hypothetical protein Q5762_22690 [Streptomyces sp. P9(2023)]|uniref:hypothetical protein n=1 Tax=Streptomyces sp. P9(2023) TaxID=3064394 RepID=UPI0028F41915|nr:hypothetical protein [Streptomyces sp. P9(2023)]MDT9691104.1 hypothetical protein [Streptomyces sp. P9(2023)]